MNSLATSLIIQLRNSGERIYAVEQMLVWTFIHREVLRTRANRRPVDIVDICEDNTSTLGLFRRIGRVLNWVTTRRELRKLTSDRGLEPQKEGRQCLDTRDLRR